jgi:hypothetical protein
LSAKCKNTEPVEEKYHTKINNKIILEVQQAQMAHKKTKQIYHMKNKKHKPSHFQKRNLQEIRDGKDIAGTTIFCLHAKPATNPKQSNTIIR